MDSPLPSAHPNIIAPPPLLFAGFALTGFGLHWMLPLRIPSEFGWRLAIGLFFVAAGAALARWAFAHFRRHATSASPRDSAVALIQDRPFALSRNPVYVAMSLLYLGVAFGLGSGWLLLLPVLLVAMHVGVVRPEERYLTTRFGDAYA